MAPLFSEDIEAALASLAEERGITVDEAIDLIIRDWLVGYGLLPIEALDSHED